jgi:copper chaperone
MASSFNPMEIRMITLEVQDMTCGHCASTITKALKQLDPQARVEIDLGAHRVRVTSAESAEDVAAAIREEGYTPVVAEA